MLATGFRNQFVLDIEVEKQDIHAEKPQCVAGDRMGREEGTST